MAAGPKGPEGLPADWAPALATDLAELIAAATELTQLVGTPDISDDFTSKLTRLATAGSTR